MTVKTTKNKNKGSKRFHTKDDCPYVRRAEGMLDRDRSTLEAWGYEECEWCREGKMQRNNGEEWSKLNAKLKSGQLGV